MTSRKRTNANIDRIRTEIKKFVYQGIPDKEIIDTLAIPRRTFYTYKKKILETEKALWREITSEYLEMELVRLRNSLEYLYQTAMELSEQEDYNDRIGACQAAADARLSQVHLLIETPELMSDMQQQQAKQKSQSKIMQQLQPHP